METCNNKPRTVIAEIMWCMDKEEILKRSLSLKGENCYIYENFSSETHLMFKRILKELKDFGKAGKYVILKYDKLYPQDFKARW